MYLFCVYVCSCNCSTAACCKSHFGVLICGFVIKLSFQVTYIYKLFIFTTKAVLPLSRAALSLMARDPDV